MKCLKVLKHENSIMELSILNSLLFILKENSVPFQLVSYEGAYIINVSDELDFNELVFPKINMNKFIKSANTSFNKTECENFYRTFVEPLFCEDENNENLALTFKYFETLDETYLKRGKVKTYLNKNKKEKTIGLATKTSVKMIGTRTYSTGIRKLNSSNPSQLSDMCVNVVLSVLGFLMSSSYLRIGNDLEINMFYKPKKTNDFIVPKFKSFIDSKTGEEKSLKMIKNVPKTIGLTELYLINLKNLNRNFIKESYESILISMLKPSGNKPMSDKCINLPILNVSDKFLNKFIQLISFNNVNLDIKYAIADYFLNQNLEMFLNLVNVIGKDKNIRLGFNILKELINLQIDKVKKIYELKGIKKLGMALNRLINDGIGYSIQVELLNCIDLEKLIKIIKEITLIYTRTYKSNNGKGCKVINSNELEEIIVIIENIQDVKIIASMLVTYSSIYIEEKKDKVVI